MVICQIIPSPFDFGGSKARSSKAFRDRMYQQVKPRFCPSPIQLWHLTHVSNTGISISIYGNPVFTCQHPIWTTTSPNSFPARSPVRDNSQLRERALPLCNNVRSLCNPNCNLPPRYASLNLLDSLSVAICALTVRMVIVGGGLLPAIDALFDVSRRKYINTF